MVYHVDISPNAEEEIERDYLWKFQRSPSNAAKWFNGLLTCVEGLRSNPLSHGLAPEAEFFGLLYGRRRDVYRILFEVRNTRVNILHVRHAARDFLRP